MALIDSNVFSAIAGAIISGVLTGAVAIWLSLRTVRTQVEINKANLVAATIERERAAKLNAYAKYLAAMEEIVEVTELRRVSPEIDHSIRETEALTSMNFALAVIDLLAPEKVVHASTEAFDVVEKPRGDHHRETLLDALLNTMRSDLGIQGSIKTLRRDERGNLVIQ